MAKVVPYPGRGVALLVLPKASVTAADKLSHGFCPNRALTVPSKVTVTAAGKS